MPLLLFILVPLAELAILIKLGEFIGIGATILLVISTAVIGVSLLKRQGLAALSRARESMEAGEFPVESVVDGACLLVAGAFLLTPGLLTDTLGFALLVPQLRLYLARLIFNKFSASGGVHMEGAGPQGAPGAGPSARQQDAPASPGKLIEGEYQEMDGDENKDEDNSDDRGKGRSSSPWRK